MMFDKKKAMETILKRQRMAGGGEILSGPTEMKNESVETSDNQPDMKHLAAEQVLHAFNSKSAHQMREALENFISAHMHQKDDDEPAPKE